MIEIEKPRIECIETPTDDSYGKYVIEPLERGYGTTLGNSLRRVLLSSLPGTAVTVAADGVAASPGEPVTPGWACWNPWWISLKAACIGRVCSKWGGWPSRPDRMEAMVIP